MGRQRIGVIGWLEYFSNEFGQTVAACDVSEGALATCKAAHPDVETFTDYREMAEKMALDAVVISTPNWVHTEMAVYFLERGIHVFLEKPMGVDKEEIDRLLAAQLCSGKICAIDFELRVSPAMVRAKEIIDSGEIGELNGIEFVHHRGAWLAQGNGVWRTDPKLSGGLFFMEICHEVDIFRYLMGEITHVQSFSHKNVLPQYPDNMPDNVVSHFWFAGGQMGTIVAGHTSSVFDAPIHLYGDTGHDMFTIITGREGCLRIEHIKQKILVCKYGEFHPDAPVGKRVEFSRLEDYAYIRNFAHDIHANQMAFLKACALGLPPHQDTIDAWKSHVVCLAAEKSATEGFPKLEVDYALPVGVEII